MKRTEFIQLIQDPDLPATRHVGALKQVVADFPYFTVSQVLLAKALHNEKHYEYEKYLKQTALVVPDREVLYYYLHNMSAPQARPQPAAEQEIREQPLPIPVVEEKQAEAPIAEQEVIGHEEPVVALPAQEETGQEEFHVLIPEPEEEPEPVVAAETNINAAEGETRHEEVLTAAALAEEPVAENHVIQDAEEDEGHSFLEWLALKGGTPGDAAITENKAAKPVQPPVPEPEANKPEIREPLKPAVQEITKADIELAVANSNINDFGNILDKFIKENPSISRPKAEFFNPMNMAKQSVEEDEELVTETLANLLYKQGNLKKAIRAYEKLCLLYPSKMTYFASLIQKIKTELKD